MTKINIKKPTGEVETLSLLSAFKENNTTWVIFDSERLGSIGLPIIYVSKYTNKLEKIVDPNEWQTAKNYLKGIINGTNFEFVKLDENVNSDEVYYTPLTLPAASFDIIKNRYVVTEEKQAEPVLTPVTPIVPDNQVQSNIEVNATPVMDPINVQPVSPIMPNNQVESNLQSSTTPVINPVNNVEPVAPVNSSVEPTPVQNVSVVNEPASMPVVEPPVAPTPVMEPTPAPTIEAPISTPSSTINFDTDKETFLKACENMFDALISKYKKELMDLEKREQAIAQKEIGNPTPVNPTTPNTMDFSTIIPHQTDNNN